MPPVAYTALRPGAWKSRFMPARGLWTFRPQPLARPRPGGNPAFPHDPALRPAFPGAAPARYASAMADEISFEDFQRVEVRVGTVVDAQPFPEARKPAIKLWVEFGGALGVRQSSAQITKHYSPDRLIGRQVLAVVNFPPRRIGPFMSEVLVLGLSDDEGRISLLAPDHQVPNGARMH